MLCILAKMIRDPKFLSQEKLLAIESLIKEGFSALYEPAFKNAMLLSFKQP